MHPKCTFHSYAPGIRQVIGRCISPHLLLLLRVLQQQVCCTAQFAAWQHQSEASLRSTHGPATGSYVSADKQRYMSPVLVTSIDFNQLAQLSVPQPVVECALQRHWRACFQGHGCYQLPGGRASAKTGHRQ